MVSWPKRCQVFSPGQDKPTWLWRSAERSKTAVNWWSRREQEQAKPMPIWCLFCSAVSVRWCLQRPKRCKTNCFLVTYPVWWKYWVYPSVWLCSRGAPITCVCTEWSRPVTAPNRPNPARKKPWPRLKPGRSPHGQAIWLNSQVWMNGRLCGHWSHRPETTVWAPAVHATALAM